MSKTICKCEVKAGLLLLFNIDSSIDQLSATHNRFVLDLAWWCAFGFQQWLIGLKLSGQSYLTLNMRYVTTIRNMRYTLSWNWTSYMLQTFPFTSFGTSFIRSHFAINSGGWIEESMVNTASLLIRVAKHFSYDLNSDAAGNCSDIVYNKSSSTYKVDAFLSSSKSQRSHRDCRAYVQHSVPWYFQRSGSAQPSYLQYSRPMFPPKTSSSWKHTAADMPRHGSSHASSGLHL